MSQLKIALLGSPVVHHGEQALTFSTRKALALLIYLTVEAGMHTRKALSELLWPELDAERGRAALRNSLLQLRVIADTPHLQQEHAHLTIKRDTLFLNRSADISLDLDTVRMAWTQSRTILHTLPQAEEARTLLQCRLEEAMYLFRGEFLAGFSLRDAPTFDSWARAQQEYWHLRTHQIFDRLSTLQEMGGEREQAIDTLNRWLGLDPLHEEAYRRLMRLNMAIGNRIAALQAYDACQAMLNTEFQVEPAPETKALFERLRSASFSQSEKRVSPINTYQPSPSTLLDGPLVGRATQFHMLIECYQRAALGQAQVVMVEGEAGIGKTRLVSDFRDWARAQGADVLQGRAFETGGQLPYQPLVEALRRRLEKEHAANDLLAETWLAELSRLLPELRERYPDLPLPTTDKMVASSHLFEAVALLIQTFARRSSLVFFLDDVHWADAASLDLLHYLVRHWTAHATPVLLVLAVRTETAERSPHFSGWRAELGHLLPVTPLPLSTLAFEDILRFLHWLHGDDEQSKTLISQSVPATLCRYTSVEQVSQWLFAQTGGQPFYLLELLRAYLEHARHTLRRREDGRWVIDFDILLQQEQVIRHLIPPNVRTVLRSRLERLPSDASAFLTASAVLGPHATFGGLCHVAALSEQEGLSALDEVLRSGLLREGVHIGKQADEETYVFPHDIVRETVYYEASRTRQRIFHRRAFEVLQEAEVPAAELIHHALAAGLVEEVCRLSIIAGDDAMQVFALHDALAHYEQARRFLMNRAHNHRALLSVVQVRSLYSRLGQAYELSNEWEQAQVVYEALLVMARDQHEPVWEWTALNHLASLLGRQSSDLNTIKPLLMQAKYVAEANGDQVGLIETERKLAYLVNCGQAPAVSRRHAERALTMARERGQTELIANSLDSLAFAMLHQGSWEETATYAEKAHALYCACGERAMEARCLNHFSYASIACGRLQTGMDALRTAYAISQEINFAWGKCVSTQHLAWGLLEMGEWGEALVMAQEGVQVARSSRLSSRLFYNLLLLGDVYQALFQLEEARMAYQEASALPSHPGNAVLLSRLCANCALTREWDDAYAYTQQWLERCHEASRYAETVTRWHEIEALLRGGDEERAQEVIRVLDEQMRTNKRYRLPYFRSLAVLAREHGERERERVYLYEALQGAEEMRLPGEVWQLRAALANLYHVSKQEEQAREMCAHAAQNIHKLVEKMNEPQRKAFLATPHVQHVLMGLT